MTATTLPIPGSAARTRPGSVRGSGAWNALLPMAGLGLTIMGWWLVTSVWLVDRPLVSQFSPQLAVQGLVELGRSGLLLDASATSVFRLLAGLGVAVVVGVGAGLLLGSVGWLDKATHPVQQFGRMVSPLSWAPVAIIAFGIGSRPVIALVAAATVWPVLAATIDGVRGVVPGHRQVALGLGASRWEVVRRVVIPSIRPRVLGGVRAAIGIGWVVLVPAEMLGVTSGLGYQILNAKDQLAYHHITALIIVIGTVGYALDVLARWALANRRERRSERGGESGGAR